MNYELWNIQYALCKIQIRKSEQAEHKVDVLS